MDHISSTIILQHLSQIEEKKREYTLVWTKYDSVSQSFCMLCNSGNIGASGSNAPILPESQLFRANNFHHTPSRLCPIRNRGQQKKCNYNTAVPALSKFRYIKFELLYTILLPYLVSPPPLAGTAACYKLDSSLLKCWWCRSKLTAILNIRLRNFFITGEIIHNI